MNEMEEDTFITVKFKNAVTGEITEQPLDLYINSSVESLTKLCNTLLKKETPVPFLFFVNDVQIKDTILNALGQKTTIEREKVLEIAYAEQSVFKVRPVTRCTSSLPGHAEAVISASFSPDGRYLASGSGDTTVRLWDVNTETPQYTCKGHKHWVLCIAWSPDGMKLATGCKNGQICVWNPNTGSQMGRTLTGHSGWIYSICWEPLHLNAECRRIASASKDCTVRVWDILTYQTVYVLSSHTASVTCVKWGGAGLIYSSSQDRTIRAWRAKDGVFCRAFQGHGHWVNTIALNTDYILRTGPYDPSAATGVYQEITETAQQLSDRALNRYRRFTQGQPEIMVSGSDDFTMYMWSPEKEKKPVTRMTGHQNLINDVKFSPNMLLIASASFDKSVKIWDGRTGKFIATLYGHVQRVYQVSWAADSRLLVSSSADSTLKVWSMDTFKLMIDLPGHADEVYAVDWSPDGQRVVSGGKDKVIKMWRK